MQRRNLIASAILAISTFTMSVSARSEEVMTGDTGLACEALLCLSPATRPKECAASLTKYFSISHRRFTDTIRGRLNFLKLCPASNQTTEMQWFTNAIANGAGRCDAASLNAQMLEGTNGDNGYTHISNHLPDYCSAYLSNAYSNLGGQTPKYVGIPERGGYWVAGSDYDAALVTYNARIAADDEANRRNQGDGN